MADSGGRLDAGRADQEDPTMGCLFYLMTAVSLSHAYAGSGELLAAESMRAARAARSVLAARATISAPDRVLPHRGRERELPHVYFDAPPTTGHRRFLR